LHRHRGVHLVSGVPVVFAIRLRRGFHGVGHVMLAAGAGLDVIRVFGSFLEAPDEVPSGHY